jgi:hypothetical protein
MATGLVNGAVEYKKPRGREADVCFLFPHCDILSVPLLLLSIAIDLDALLRYF